MLVQNTQVSFPSVSSFFSSHPLLLMFFPLVSFSSPFLFSFRPSVIPSYLSFLPPPSLPPLSPLYLPRRPPGISSSLARCLSMLVTMSDFFPSWTMKPNPQCDNHHSQLRQQKHQVLTPSLSLTVTSSHYNTHTITPSHHSLAPSLPHTITSSQHHSCTNHN